MTRNEVLSEACEKCLKELYKYVQPRVSWKNFKLENKKYTKLYKDWEFFRRIYVNKDKYPEPWEKIKDRFEGYVDKSMTECIGPKPFEFYYLPRDIMKDICDSYVYAYKLDSKQGLLDTIEVLKNYCKEPIIDKYIEGELREDGNRWPGHRGYEHPDNLEKEIQKIINGEILPDICKQYNKQYNLQTTGIESSVSKAYSQIFQNKFFEFLDMAGEFFNWNREVNSFNMSVYFGPSPNSNKEAVIENWKKYRNKDIKIDEEQIKKSYYGEEYDE